MNEKNLGDWFRWPGITVTDDDMWTANSSPLNTFYSPNYRENYGKVSINEGPSVTTFQPYQSTAIGGISFPAYLSYLGFDTTMSGTQDVAAASSSATKHINDTSYDNG
jgi:hypothetical protein